jgi:DNA topoisomerase I
LQGRSGKRRGRASFNWLFFQVFDGVNSLAAIFQDAISGAATEITRAFGEKYSKTRQYRTKSSSAQEAHEAIRPTDFTAKEASADRSEQRLYELIWKRAIASQMEDALIEKTTATVGISTLPATKLVATGEVVTFDGFLKVYIESKDEGEQTDDIKGMLPPLTIGQNLVLSIWL